ncbi:MAG: hypothetical protein JJU02_04660 [Cryomorphaceae bacterium]|nr:hypothetical protein [Cryomorphaceae bacterium]
MKNTSKTFLVIYSVIVTIGLVLSLGAFKNLKDSFEEIDVKKLNITDEEGNKIMVLTNKERMPYPILNGKEYERDVNPSGFVLYNDKGNEVGGLGIVNAPEGEKIAFVLDYSTVDGIAMYKTESSDGSYVDAGFSINDANPEGQIGDAVNRVDLSNRNKTAGLTLKDANGADRLKLFVQPDGTPKIQFLDENGNVVNELSEK